jgi:serine/threonine protein kinase
MVDPSASRFWQAALQSGLVDARGLTACWEAIPPEKRNAPEHLDRRLARQAVQQELVTLWQAQQLIAGRTNGFRVDRYVLCNLIGHGGMGRVYLARDTRLGRLVALKILSPERMSNPRAIARFQREARVGALLQHENLVRLYDFGESNGRYFLVMEYIDGKTVGALITAQGPMPPATAVRLTRQIALGLEHIHRKGLIHRDVNPYNILVTHEGVAKLADLGLAIDLADEERVTREGATVGTFDYVAPEQARHSHSADIRSDIYSLGCTIYHMIAGRVPFPSPSLPEKLFAHQALEPEPLDRIISDVPPGLVEVVQRMMRKNPEERYATPLQVAQALELFLPEYSLRARDLDDENTPPQGMEKGSRSVANPPSPSQSGEVFAASSGHPAQSSLGGAEGRSLGRETGAQVAASGQLASSSGIPGTGPPAVMTPPILTPVEDDIPLLVDLGPEPPLTESLPRPRSWFGLEKLTRSESGSGSSEGGPAAAPPREKGRWWWKRRHFWVLAVIALMVALLLFGTAVARTLWGEWAGGWARFRKVPPSSSDRSQTGKESSEAAQPSIQEARSLESAPIRVLTPDGQESPAADFTEAIELALGGKGVIVFHNREPLTLTAGGRGDLVFANGWLTLRAAPGVNPVLIIEQGSTRPWLTVGAAMNLILEGLTMIAHLPPKPSGSSAAPPPLIKAAGPVEVRSCSFQARGPGATTGTVALLSDGAHLKVDRCWFQGFGTAIEARALGGSSTEIRQSIFVGSLAAERPGWAVRYRYQGGGRRTGRRLAFDHCTVSSWGWLELVGFAPEAAPQLEVTACAIRTEALVAWEPARPDIPLTRESVKWTGKGNLLDVRGRSWVVRSRDLAPGLPPDITNQESWSRVVEELDPLTGEIEFPVAAPSAPESLRESQVFTIRVTPHGAANVGADAALVGPPTPPSL